MNILYRILLVMLVALSSVLVFIIVRQSRARIDYLPSEVSSDSIMGYARKADSLELTADLLEAELEEKGLIEQLTTRPLLEQLRNEIAALRNAVERHRVANTPAEQDQVWRECILLYGRATGVCDALMMELPEEEEAN